MSNAAALVDTAILHRGDGSQDTRPVRPQDVPDNVHELLASAQAAQVIGGYRILSVLGTGGMGMVFRAEDPLLKRVVALKVMKPGAAADAGSRERFLREAQSAAALRHDNVVTIYQVGHDRDVPFLAMEYLEGESLRERLARLGQLDPPQALRIAREAAAGLAAAHAKELIHRDIKPENLWIEESGRVKVLDFGLARAADSQLHLTQSGMILGTPNYLAPEQASGAAVDARTDLFSLGVVLYEMLTGVRPFQREGLIATLTAIAKEPPPPVAKQAPDVPATAAQIVQRLLEKKAAARFASADELIAAIDAHSRPMPQERLKSWTQPSVLVGLAVAALLVAAMGIWVIVRNREGKEVARIQIPEQGTATIQLEKDEDKKAAVAADEHPLERDAAETILRGGGVLLIWLEGGTQSKWIASLDELPHGKWRISEVSLGPKTKVEELEKLKLLPIFAGLSIEHSTIPAREILPRIGGIERMYFLSMNNARLTSDDLQFILKFPHLNILQAYDSNWGDEDIKQLVQLKELQSLNLGGSAITDAALLDLARLPKLESLWLYLTHVSDHGLEHLLECKSLRFLNLGETKVSEKGLAEFRRQRPDCTVQLDR